jgi:AcrR family transcriptional regulator
MARGKATLAEVHAAALRRLERDGADAVTMRGVAKEVGISAMAIYHYYPSREALLTAVTDEAFAQFKDLIPPLARRSPISQLLAKIEAFVEFCLARPRLVDYVFASDRADARRFPTDFSAGRSPLFSRFANAIEAAMRAGSLRRDDVGEVTLALWALVQGLLALHRRGRFDLEADEFRALLRRSVRRVLHGLGRPPKKLLAKAKEFTR